MSEPNRPDEASLVTDCRRDLAMVGGVNSLVVRGIADLGQLAIRKDSAYFYTRGLQSFEKSDHQSAKNDFDEAIHLDSNNADAYWCRAKVWFAWGFRGAANRDLSEAIRIVPCNANYYYDRGIMHPGNTVSAGISDLTEAIRLAPEFADAYFERGRVGTICIHMSVGYYCGRNSRFARDAVRICGVKDVEDLPLFFDQTIKDFQETIRLRPHHVDAYLALARLLATGPDPEFRDGRRAIQLASKACDLSGWKNGGNLDTLAAAYADDGQFGEAMRYQTMALADPVYQGTAGNELRNRLKLYEQRKPYRKKVWHER